MWDVIVFFIFVVFRFVLAMDFNSTAKEGKEDTGDRTSSEYQEISTRDIQFRTSTPQRNEGEEQEVERGAASVREHQRAQQPLLAQRGYELDQLYRRGDIGKEELHRDVKPRVPGNTGLPGPSGARRDEVPRARENRDLDHQLEQDRIPQRARNEHSSQPVTRPDRYDGSESLTFYLQHFELCAM